MPDIQTLQLLTALGTLIGMVFVVYKNVRQPGETSSQRLDRLETGCELKHRVIDENLILIKENHLRHIEADISELKQGQVKILTILEERER